MNRREILERRMTMGRQSGKADRSYIALLGPHEYLYMETSCVSRTKTLLLTHISLVWKDTLKSRKP